MKKYRIEEKPRMTIDTGLSADEIALFANLLSSEAKALEELQRIRTELGTYRSIKLISEIAHRKQFITDLQVILGKSHVP